MSNIKNYKIIVKPIVTEKSSFGSEYNQVTFKVDNNSTKKEIKVAIEKIFKVKVKKVNTSNVKGKVKSYQLTVAQTTRVDGELLTNSIEVASGAEIAGSIARVS